MKRIAIIGAGISGLTCARLLKHRFDVTVFEKEHEPGGLVRCRSVNGSLFHICGGHVFNTKNPIVSKWFWSIFNRDKDFVLAKRRSAVCLDNGMFVDYPIENHIYQLPPVVRKKIYAEITQLAGMPSEPANNFGDFLQKRFGETLYRLYFKPYNDKIWRCDLHTIPLDWLEGKLPMPTPNDMLTANKHHREECDFVHSCFYYPKKGGSQFIVNTLADGVNVVCDAVVGRVEREDGGLRLFWRDGSALYNHVVFCGNLNNLSEIIGTNLLPGGGLCAHGTTSVFCETSKIPYSWFYQPGRRHDSHRVICTGNFSENNNASGKNTCTVEFTDQKSVDEILPQLKKMPYSPSYIAHNYFTDTYPIQSASTRRVVSEIKSRLVAQGISLVGRFAEWEYFNMDAAMASAMRAVEEIIAMNS